MSVLICARRLQGQNVLGIVADRAAVRDYQIGKRKNLQLIRFVKARCAAQIGCGSESVAAIAGRGVYGCAGRKVRGKWA